MKQYRITAAYRLLGLHEGATMRELKKNFHAKAVRFHPDLNPSPAAAEEFKNIAHAYDILKDHLKKAKRAEAPAQKPPPVRTRAVREKPVRVGDDITSRLPAAELAFRVSNSQNKYVRLHAIRALAEVGGRDAAWLFIKSLSDTEPDVRREAVAGLGHMRARFAVIPLIRLYRSGDAACAEAVLDALRNINSPIGKKFLLSLEQENAAPEQSAKAAANSKDIA